MGGRAVQLVGGKRPAVVVDDVVGLVSRFRRYRKLHVIDLDAAMGQGHNRGLVHQIITAARVPVRVGGGVRSVGHAERLITAGAQQVIVGSRVFRSGRPDLAFLKSLRSVLGRSRVMIALDSRAGRIAIHGWKKRIGLRAPDVIARLSPYCGAFLCTDVDREGSLGGVRLDFFRDLRTATDRPIVAAGGVRNRSDVSALARLGMDAAVGMALYTGGIGRAFLPPKA